MKYSVKDIEDIIYKYLPKEEGYPVTVLTAMNYGFMAGGKRLRPMMMKLCYDMFIDKDYRDADKIISPFMAAIEMIHTYSLIHDDLPALDNDELRRGKPTVHAKFGEDIGILAGDGLLNYAYETAAKAFSEKPGSVEIEKAYTILASKPGIDGMIGGQVLDVIMSGKEVDEKQLEYIYLNKTSALIECAFMIGAYLGGASKEDVDTLCMVARNVGMAFQVQDDILDIIGDEAVLGKPVLSDDKNNKFTYVTIHGMDSAKDYVSSASKEAVSMLDTLKVKNEKAKSEMKDLILALINRDK